MKKKKKGINGESEGRGEVCVLLCLEHNILHEAFGGFVHRIGHRGNGEEETKYERKTGIQKTKERRRRRIK